MGCSPGLGSQIVQAVAKIIPADEEIPVALRQLPQEAVDAVGQLPAFILRFHGAQGGEGIRQLVQSGVVAAVALLGGVPLAAGQCAVPGDGTAEGCKGARLLRWNGVPHSQGNFQVQNAIPADAAATDSLLLTLAAGCEQFSTHPIAVSIVTAAKEAGLEIPKPTHLTELAGEGIQAELDGHRVLCGNQKLMASNGVSLDKFQGASFGTQVLLARDGKLLGQIVIADTLKGDAVTAIGQLKTMGLHTVMLTGDAENSAKHVAQETGIDEVRARLLPENKLSELEKVRAQQGSVMFVGDGINDAPVLAGADVGAAMGSGADAAIEAADVVFMNSDMSAIPQAIQIARRTRRISWQNVYFALAVKIVVMALGLLGYANMWIAVFADTGVSMLCLLNSIRILYHK